MRSTRIVLASGSPARRALLEAAGIAVDVTSPRVDEALVKASARGLGCSAGETALRLAREKAASIGAVDGVVIGADQLLVCDGAWFDKPVDLAAARRQLRALRGRAHVLETACVVIRGQAELWASVSRPALAMRMFSEAFLDDYLAAEGEALLGCVGAYRLEGRGVQLFERIEGEHAAILGLPLLGLLAALREAGVVSH